MAKLVLFLSLIIALPFVFHPAQKQDVNGIKPGLYEYSYISTHISDADVKEGSWLTPKKLRDTNVTFKVVDRKTIYKGIRNPAGKYEWFETLRLVSESDLSKYKPVPKKILDFNLIGVYYFDKRYNDMFRVLYYSKSRNSFLDQLHVYALNRINYMSVHMNKPFHPFYDVHKYFSLPAKEDSIYIAPPQKIKLK